MDLKLYVLGDSISLHYGPYLERNLRGIAAYARKNAAEEEALQVEQPMGDNGGDSSMVLTFLRAKIAFQALDADTLLVNCGLHDIKTDPTTSRRQIPLDHYRANLRSLVELTAMTRAQLIWVRTTPCDEQIHNGPGMQFHRFAADCAAYNAAADQIMHATGVPVVDLHTFTANLGPDLYCDHVHFHDWVREQQAAYLAGWLTSFWTNAG